jgi:hypothetical protein
MADPLIYRCNVDAQKLFERMHHDGKVLNDEPVQDSLSSHLEAECKKKWAEIEGRIMNGQKLQGTLTANEVYAVLESRGVLNAFPLIKTIYDIAFKGKPVDQIVEGIIVSNERSKLHL